MTSLANIKISFKMKIITDIVYNGKVVISAKYIDAGNNAEYDHLVNFWIVDKIWKAGRKSRKFIEDLLYELFVEKYPTWSCEDTFYFDGFDWEKE